MNSNEQKAAIEANPMLAAALLPHHMADILQLYIGCKGECFIRYGCEDNQCAWVNCVILGINKRKKVVYVKCKDIYGNEWDDYREVPYLEVLPILRPISDMTEQEDDLFSAIGYKLFSNESPALNAILKNAAQTKYLLSKHFDLFGLIQSGLAKQEKLTKELR